MNIYNILSLENLYNKKYSYFSTPAHHILGLNYISTICTPASDWQKLHEDIERKFLNIKKHSCVQNSNPIMIGCIPFDTNQPCSLHFYEDHINSKSKFFSNVTDSKVPKLLKKQSLVDVGKFKNTVEKCKSKFQNTKLEKIVLSQAIDYWFEAPLQPECFIRNLLQKNSNAYNFILPLKDCSFIFGASPELLISKQGNYIHSNPLAGSK